MLEAVTTDLVFTISLKRSTQNLQLSTSWVGRLPHLMAPTLVVELRLEAIREPRRFPVLRLRCTSEGAPAPPPQAQASLPSQGRSGWSSQTQPQSSQREHFMAFRPYPDFRHESPVMFDSAVPKAYNRQETWLRVADWLKLAQSAEDRDGKQRK